MIMKELKLLTEWADTVIGKYNKPKILEGGNIFKSPEFSKENPEMLTDRINKSEVQPTVEFLEVMTGINVADALLGSTGKVASSGDIDVAIDKNKVSKEQLMDHMIEQGVDPAHLQKTGDSVHYMSPIWQQGGEKTNRFVQVDFMFVPDVEFAKWSMSTAPDSTYKGVYLQKLRADLVRTANPDWKWNHFNGVLSRTDNSSVFGFDPDKIAKGLLGKSATVADLESVERVLAALKNNRGDINTQVRDAYRTTLAPRKPGEQPDPNAPQIDEMKIGQAARGVGNSGSKVGREFQHLEDLVYIEGVAGVKRALDRLAQIAQNTKPLEVKWDGCVDPDLLLETNQGKLRMEEVIDRHQLGEELTVLAHDFDTNSDKMVKVRESVKKIGNKEWVEIELENGDIIRTTADHEVFTTNRGWVEAADLTEDDDIKELGREKM